MRPGHRRVDPVVNHFDSADMGLPGPVLLILFMGGAVLGTLTLAAAQWRSPLVPRVVPRVRPRLRGPRLRGRLGRGKPHGGAGRQRDPRLGGGDWILPYGAERWTMTLTMAARSAALAPAVVAGATGVLAAATLGLAWVNHQGPQEFLAGNRANMWLAGLAFGIVAALVLRDRPDNRLGPIFAVASLLESVCAAASELATYMIETRPGALPGRDLIAWFGTVLWMPGFLMLFVAVPLLFPDGRLASPRWRWPARVAWPAGS